MKFKMIVRHMGAEPGTGWVEECDDPSVTDTDSALISARFLISRYNMTQYTGDLPREIVRVIFRGEEGNREHDWEKTNLVTIMKGGSMYDTARCRRCGCEARRYGLGGYTRIGKWAKDKWRYCK